MSCVVVMIRSFVTSKFCCDKRLRQQYGIMEKLLKQGVKSKHRTQSRPHDYSSHGDRLKQFIPGRSSKRQTVINVLLMNNISDLMSTGEIGKELSGCGLEIYRVQVSQDFSVVNVFWGASGSVETVQKILDSHANRLRITLNGLHIMGSIPYIKFVYDKRQSASKEVMELLAKADFGLGYESQGVANYKEDSIANKQDRIRSLEFIEVPEKEQDDDNFPVTLTKPSLPAMTHNMLGLDHKSLMKKVLEHTGKTKTKVMDYTESKQAVKQSLVMVQDKSEKEKFTKFLRDRKKQVMLAKTKLTRSDEDIAMSKYEDEVEEIEDEEDVFDEELEYSDLKKE